MGANVSSAMSNMISKIENRLSQTAGVSSTANCDISIGNIDFNNSDGCSFSTENLCGASSNAALGAISEAVADAWGNLSNQQKTAFLSGINVSKTKQEIQNYVEQELEQECQANSNITQEIATGNITVTNCTGGAQFKVINSGTAQSNCAINSVLQSVANTSAKLQSEQEGEGFLNQLLDGLLSFFGSYEKTLGAIGSSSSLSICCCCLIIIFIIILLMFAK